MGEQREASGRSRRWRRRALAAAALTVLLLPVAACGGDDNKDSASKSDDTTGTTANAADLLGSTNKATGEPVKIGMVSDGATDAYDNTDELRSAKAAAEYWNNYKGGIGGRPIQVVTCETKGDPAGATDCGNKMVEQKVTAVTLSQSGVADSLYTPLHAAGIPTFFFQYNGSEMLADKKDSFVMQNPLATLFGVPIATAEKAKTDRIDFIVIDVPVALSSFESGDAKKILDKAGMKYDLIKIPIGTADVTAQMQQVVSNGAGTVQIIANDALCIAAINGLKAVGYTGAIATVSQCITDATRKGVPNGGLEGVNITATQAVGAKDDTAYQRYEAVMAKYGTDVKDVPNALAMGGYTSMSSLAESLAGIEGDITTTSAAAAIKAMKESDFPGADGITFQCGGTVFPAQPAVCTNQSLRATLDKDGNPAKYDPVDSTDILP
ncbi:MAG TPA: ABC transporter substrate-binding protein [Acidimicrobiales bacterium]|nr:ABC transporter substrate-binding protein [Acidimicrobiales bacterium]